MSLHRDVLAAAPADITGTPVVAVLSGPTRHRWWSWRRWVGAERGPTWSLAVDLDPACPPDLTPGPEAGSVQG